MLVVVEVARSVTGRGLPTPPCLNVRRQPLPLVAITIPSIDLGVSRYAKKVTQALANKQGEEGGGGVDEREQEEDKEEEEKSAQDSEDGLILRTSKRGSSRFKGVSSLNKRDTWRAIHYSAHANKTVYLGDYPSELDAARAYSEYFSRHSKNVVGPKHLSATVGSPAKPHP